MSPYIASQMPQWYSTSSSENSTVVTSGNIFLIAVVFALSRLRRLVSAALTAPRFLLVSKVFFLLHLPAWLLMGLFLLVLDGSPLE